MTMTSIVVGTRIHWHNHSQSQRIDVDTSLRQVKACYARASTYADGIVIALGLPQPPSNGNNAFHSSVQEFLQRLKEEIKDTPPLTGDTESGRQIPVVLLPMLHWGRFVPALNAIIGKAATEFPDASFLLLQSLEIEVDAESVCFLKTHFKPGSDLVIGAALPGHTFHPGSEQPLELNGLTTPWNTLALWNLTQLAKIGFPLIGDGLKMEDAAAGVEEVCTITLYQQMFPHTSRAKVMQVPGIVWQVDDFKDQERRAWQEKKMASKLQRADKQIKHLGIPSGKVYHFQI